MADEPTPTGDKPEANPVPPTNTDETEKWKALARQHEKASKAAAKRLEELEGQLSTIEAATQSETEKLIAQARKEGAKEATDKFLSDIRQERLTATVSRLAAGKFADVDDALKFLSLDDNDAFDADNVPNANAIQTALDEVLDKKPYLAADPNASGRPAGSVDAGRGDGTKPSADPAQEHNQQLAALLGHAA